MVFIHQFRHGTAAITLEIPGGVVDGDDPDPLAAARRKIGLRGQWVAVATLGGIEGFVAAEYVQAVNLPDPLVAGPGVAPANGGGSLAVDAFFVLSGFLVARSYLQLHSVGRYAWHRALRILPGFWVALVVTAAIVAATAHANVAGCAGRCVLACGASTVGSAASAAANRTEKPDAAPPVPRRWSPIAW